MNRVRALLGAPLNGDAVLLDAGCGSGAAMNVFNDDPSTHPRALLLVDSNASCLQVAKCIADDESDCIYEDKPISTREFNLHDLQDDDLEGVTHVTEYPGYPPFKNQHSAKERTRSTELAIKILGNPTTIEFNSTKLTLPYLAALALDSPLLSRLLEEYIAVQITGLHQRETRLTVWMYIKRQPQVRFHFTRHIAFIVPAYTKTTSAVTIATVNRIGETWARIAVILWQRR